MWGIKLSFVPVPPPIHVNIVFKYHTFLAVVLLDLLYVVPACCRLILPVFLYTKLPTKALTVI